MANALKIHSNLPFVIYPNITGYVRRCWHP